MTFPLGRPPSACRALRSAAVDEAIDSVCAEIADAGLATTFRNCLPNTLDTAVRYSPGRRPRTFVVTGDIPAMWLRDASFQVQPYLRFATQDDNLRCMLAGVINQQVDHLLADAYANAFEAEPGHSPWAEDATEMCPMVHERKWELDSPCGWMRLSAGYWRATGDLKPFDSAWHLAWKRVRAVLHEQMGDGRHSSYRFQRRTANPLDTLMSEGAGPPSASCSLIRSAFRPSDDACTFPLLVPANFMAMAALRDVALLLETLGEAAEAEWARALSDQLRSALDMLPVPWPYEVDGFGSQLVMDDANLPSLLGLPWLGACSVDDPHYLVTRSAVLSRANPWYFEGTAARGVGSPHTGPGRVWPLALIVQALTSLDEAEIAECLQALLRSQAGTGFMHESFDCNDASRFTRPWFAWANSMFGELILQLHEQQPHLLRRRWS
jgi:meiotically up-regulated gene 157 (Mug157) protein